MHAVGLLLPNSSTHSFPSSSKRVARHRETRYVIVARLVRLTGDATVREWRGISTGNGPREITDCLRASSAAGLQTRALPVAPEALRRDARGDQLTLL